MEMCEYTGVRWSVGNREEPALSHIDSGSAGHTRERLTHKSDTITFRSGCSMSSFVTETLSKWEVTVLKGVGRLPQPSPPLQGAFPVRGPNGNEKCSLYGGYDRVSGPTASAPARLPLCRHRSLAALASARCGLLSSSRSSWSRSCSHSPCGAALRKEVSLPPSYPKGHSWGKRSSPRPCASGGRWLPPICLPSPRCASHSLLSPHGRRRASWKVWRKCTWPVAPELWERQFLSLKEKARTPLQVSVLWTSITFIFTDLKENMGTSLSQSDSQDLPSGPAAKNPAANVEAMCLSPGPGSLHRERSPWAEDWGPRRSPRKRINHFKTGKWDEAGQGTESDF